MFAVTDVRRCTVVDVQESGEAVTVTVAAVNDPSWTAWAEVRRDFAPRVGDRFGAMKTPTQALYEEEDCEEALGVPWKQLP